MICIVYNSAAQEHGYNCNGHDDYMAEVLINSFCWPMVSELISIHQQKLKSSAGDLKEKQYSATVFGIDCRRRCIKSRVPDLKKRR